MLDGHTQNISEARGDGMYCFLCDIIGVVPMARMIALMPFLYARMFSSIAKFSSVINQGIIQQFLYAAVKAIGMDVYITRAGWIDEGKWTYYAFLKRYVFELLLALSQASNSEFVLNCKVSNLRHSGFHKAGEFRLRGAES
nr:importin-9 isoform X2 [Ipomoea batatas]